MGAGGGELPLPAAVAAAKRLVERSARLRLAQAASAPGAAASCTLPFSADELGALHDRLAKLAAGGLSPSAAEALLLELARRPPPAVPMLRASRVGVALRRCERHNHAQVAAIASHVLASWRSAAEAEDRRNRRVAALGAASEGEARSGAAASRADISLAPARAHAVVLIGEALSVDSAEPGEPKAEFGQPAAGPRTAADVAVAVEAEVYKAVGKATGKAYQARCRSLASLLRAPRAAELRANVRAGRCSVEEFCGLRASDALISEQERARRQEKREREARAIEMLRSENAGEASDAYTCTECKGRRCALFHTNSMGAVHLTTVPDMIVQCLDCMHRFTI